MNRFYKRYLVPEDTKVSLKDYDPNDTMDFKNKEEALALLAKNNHEIAKLQSKLYSENKQSLLIVLQALDAGGKDGTINNVLSAMNPQGCRVQSFKTPTPLEQSHDFLWRVHAVAPHNGEVVIFNRSYYEAVLVEKVHEIADEKTVNFRYKAIKNFEELLTFHNTKIVKFYLHISKDEQLRRFVRRLEDPEKHWKISDNDYPERKHWNKYIDAYESMLSKCSTKDSPWFIIPGNSKWFRNLAVSQIILETLKNMNIKMPAPSVDLQVATQLAQEELRKSNLL